MKTVTDTTSEFTNYPAFAFHFKPVTIMKIGRDDYVVFYGGTEPENQIQRGTKEYM